MVQSETAAVVKLTTETEVPKNSHYNRRNVSEVQQRETTALQILKYWMLKETDY